jgi:hypothetical protein
LLIFSIICPIKPKDIQPSEEEEMKNMGDFEIKQETPQEFKEKLFENKQEFNTKDEFMIKS